MSIKEKPTEKKKVNDQGTFTKFPNILFDECDLPETAQIIFMRLCRHVCHKNNVFVGSIRKLSNLVRISKSTVERMLPRLEEVHYIKKEWDEERKQMIIHVLMAPLWEQNKSRNEPTPDLGPHNSIIVPNWDTREINYLNYDAFVPEWDDLMEAVNNPVPKRDKFVPKWDRSGSNWDKSVPPSSSNVGTTTITTITTETTRENAHVSDDNAPTPSLSESNSPSSLQSIPPEEKAPAQSDEQSSKQAVSDSQSKDVPPAQDTGKTSSGKGKKTANTRTRRTKKTEFVVPEELLPRVDAFYGFIDTWIQGKMGDPDEGYEHTPEGNAAICDLLTCKKPPTHNRFKKMLDEMWDEPKNAKTGWHTRAHMGEVPFLCKEYKSRRLAVAATERKETSTKSTLETATALAASAGYRNQIWDDDDDDLEYLTPVSKKQGA